MIEYSLRKRIVHVCRLGIFNIYNEMKYVKIRKSSIVILKVITEDAHFNSVVRLFQMVAVAISHSLFPKLVLCFLGVMDGIINIQVY